LRQFTFNCNRPISAALAAGSECALL